MKGDSQDRGIPRAQVTPERRTAVAMVDLVRNLFVGCCGCIPEQLDSEGTVPSAPMKEAFRSYRRRSRTELAEDVTEPSLNLNGWTVRDGQRIVMMEIEKETKTIAVALEPAQDAKGLVITGLDANGLVAEWNVDRPLRAVHVGDVIVEVNKKGGTAKELLKQIQKHEHLRLLVQCN